MERHLGLFGIMPDNEFDEEAKKLLQEKRAAFALAKDPTTERKVHRTSFRPVHTMCAYCSTKAAILTQPV